LVLGLLTVGAPTARAGSAPVFAAIVQGANYSGHLVVGHLGGSGKTILTDPDYGIHAPAVSPSGTRIAFALGSYEDQQLAVIDADGSNELVLTQTRGVTYQSVIWSADERTLYYGRYRSDGTGSDSIWKIATDGSGSGVELTGAAKASPSSVRVGGPWLAINSYRPMTRRGLCAVMRLDGTDRKNVGPNACQQPIWRPGRSQLAVRVITRDEIHLNITIELRMVSIRTGRVHDVPHTQSSSKIGRVLPLAWSDDGQFVYYQHWAGKGDDFRVYRIRPDGTGKKDVTPDLPHGADMFAVQPAS
jgi:Tol biopolymer transport system component